MLQTHFKVQMENFFLDFTKNNMAIEHPIEKYMIFSKIEGIDNLEECLTKMADEDFLCMSMEYLADARMSSLLDDTGRPTAQKVCNEFKTLYFVAVLEKDSLHLDTFNLWIGVAMANGLLEKYDRDRNIFEQVKLFQKDDAFETDNGPHKLTLDRTKGIFAVYVIGMALASVCLFMELLWKALVGN